MDTTFLVDQAQGACQNYQDNFFGGKEEKLFC